MKPRLKPTDHFSVLSLVINATETDNKTYEVSIYGNAIKYVILKLQLIYFKYWSIEYAITPIAVILAMITNRLAVSVTTQIKALLNELPNLLFSDAAQMQTTTT